MIRTSYDPKADVLHVEFGPENTLPDMSEEIAPGVYLEFDQDGRPIAVEITSASTRHTDARALLPQHTNDLVAQTST